MDEHDAWDDDGKWTWGELLLFFLACAALTGLSKLESIRKAVGW